MAICGNCKSEGVGLDHIRQCCGVEPAPVSDPIGIGEISDEELDAYMDEEFENRGAGQDSDEPQFPEDEPDPEPKGRVDVRVPYADKEEAKKFGTKWDRDKKTWYLPNGVPEGFPEKWLAGERASGTPAEEGFYVMNGEVYKVQLAVHGSGKPYAKRLVVTEDKVGHWTMSPGTVFHLKEEHKMTLSQAKELGHLYGVCVRCGRTLTDESSIEAGIGPICAGKMEI